jgi:hypothetical protein
MDVRPGEEATKVVDRPGEHEVAFEELPVGDPLEQDGMKTRTEPQRLVERFGGGVSFDNRVDGILPAHGLCLKQIRAQIDFPERICWPLSIERTYYCSPHYNVYGPLMKGK